MERVTKRLKKRTLGDVGEAIMERATKN